MTIVDIYRLYFAFRLACDQVVCLLSLCVGVNECRPPYVPACMCESVRMRARGYWHKDYVSIWQKDACKALWDTLRIKPHFHRSPQKGVHSSFIKKRITTPNPPPLPLLTLPHSLPFCSARPDRPKGSSWPHLTQIYPHIPRGFPVTSDLKSQPTRPISSPSIPGKPGLIDVFHHVSTFTYKHIGFIRLSALSWM